jgi:exopolyphosphatase/guanosine-5'-triphosphate,3'-diphosphate pyrophosphatase
VLVDVGGGSTEVTHVQQGRPIYSRSLPLGSVRMLMEHREHRAMKDAADLAAAQLARRLGKMPRMIATGGSARALARLCGHDGVIEVEEMRSIVRSMRRMTPLERVREHGLRSDRADTIVPAGVVFIRIALALGARSILAPDVGLRDGILAELGAAARRRAA